MKCKFFAISRIQWILGTWWVALNVLNGIVPFGFDMQGKAAEFPPLAEFPPPEVDALDQPIPSMAERERRKQPRAKVCWPVRLFRMSSDTVIESITRNLSSVGFYCLSPVPLDFSEAVLCILSLPAHDPRSKRRELPLHCQVRVVRVDTEAQQGLTGIACRIEDYHFPPLESVQSQS